MGAYFGIFIVLLSSIVLDSIVAKIGDESITYSDIVREGELLNIENGQPHDTPLTPVLKKKILELIVTRYLLRQEAKTQDITISVKQLEQKIRIYRGNRQMEPFLIRWNLKDVDFRALVRARMLSDKMTSEHMKRLGKEKKSSEQEQSKELKEWVKKLKKRWKIVVYPIP